MNRTVAIFALLLLACSALQLRADVYVWTDENGVKHYSNVAPSEASEEFDKDKELKSNAGPGTAAPPPRRGSRPGTPKASAPTRTPRSDAASGAKGSTSAADQGPEAETPEVLRLDLKKFPMPQDELVKREKTIVKGLKKELEKPGASRDAALKKEENRLLKAIQDLNEASVDKFGSQKNKNRQVGYYKYRLDALLNSPDTYFDYGESDTD
jgi:hypothetical protein